MRRTPIPTLTKFRGIRLNPAQDEALEELAAQRDCSVSDLVREALVDHFSLPSNSTLRRAALQEAAIASALSGTQPAAVEEQDPARIAE